MSLGSFVTSIFTPPGTNAAKNQGKRNAKVADIGGKLAGALEPDILANIEYARMLEPLRKALIDRLLVLTGQAPDTGEMRNRVLGNAEDGARRSDHNLRGLGFGSGAREGAATEFIGAGHRQANEMEQNMLGEEGQVQRILAALSGVAGGQAPNAQWGNLSQAANLVYGAPPVQVGAGLLDYLAPIAQSWAAGQMGGVGGAKAPAAASPAAAMPAWNPVPTSIPVNFGGSGGYGGYQAPNYNFGF